MTEFPLRSFARGSTRGSSGESDGDHFCGVIAIDWQRGSSIIENVDCEFTMLLGYLNSLTLGRRRIL